MSEPMTITMIESKFDGPFIFGRLDEESAARMRHEEQTTLDAREARILRKHGFAARAMDAIREFQYRQGWSDFLSRLEGRAI